MTSPVCLYFALTNRVRTRSTWPFMTRWKGRFRWQNFLTMITSATWSLSWSRSSPRMMNWNRLCCSLYFRNCRPKRRKLMRFSKALIFSSRCWPRLRSKRVRGVLCRKLNSSSATSSSFRRCNRSSRWPFNVLELSFSIWIWCKWTRSYKDRHSGYTTIRSSWTWTRQR